MEEQKTLGPRVETERDIVARTAHALAAMTEGHWWTATDYLVQATDLAKAMTRTELEAH